MNLPPTDKVYYLASPYSHPNGLVKQLRYLLIAAVAAELFHKGYTLLEPIATAHPMAQLFAMPTGYEAWQTRDRNMISRADGLIVATLPGWQESVGVADEIQYAESLGKPVYYVSPVALLGDDFFEDLQEAIAVV